MLGTSSWANGTDSRVKVSWMQLRDRIGLVAEDYGLTNKRGLVKPNVTSSPLTKSSPSMQLLPRFNPIPILRYMLGLNITLATEGTSQTFLRIMHCPWFIMSYKHARWVPDKSFIDLIHRGLDHYGTSSILVALIGSLYCHIIMKTYSSVLTVVGGWPS